ncbi:hypothetical protein ACPVPU_04755 [Sphingomonas sp. CJ99]
MRGAADWAGRTLFLILSGMATYAVMMAMLSIGSELRQPDGTGDGNRVTAPTATADRSRAERRATPLTRPRSGDTGADSPRPGAAGTPAVAATIAPDPELARWAEALTWAVLALAGFAAAGVIVLLKITAQLARIAGARAL